MAGQGLAPQPCGGPTRAHALMDHGHQREFLHERCHGERRQIDDEGPAGAPQVKQGNGGEKRACRHLGGAAHRGHGCSRQDAGRDEVAVLIAP